MSTETVVLLCFIGPVVSVFFGWCLWVLKNPERLARLQEKWQPVEEDE